MNSFLYFIYNENCTNSNSTVSIFNKLKTLNVNFPISICKNISDINSWLIYNKPRTNYYTNWIALLHYNRETIVTMPVFMC